MDMTKQLLKDRIDGLDIDKGFKSALLGLVDKAREVSPDLLEVVADLLEEQAKFEAGRADIYAEEQERLQQLGRDIEAFEQEFLALTAD